MPTKVRDLRRQRRAAWIAENGPCVYCGSNKELEIDHVDWRTKEYNTAHIWVRAKPIRDAELAKCQVLCRECHSKKSAGEMRDRNTGRSLIQEHPPAEMAVLKCVGCSAEFDRFARKERFRAKHRGSGPYCSEGCRNRSLNEQRWHNFYSSPEYKDVTEKIISLALQGCSMKQIREQVPFGYERIRKTLREHNIKPRHHHARVHHTSPEC